MVDLERAYASCERRVRGHYENFPVASLLIPASMRHHVAALYAFARTADDIADEGQLQPHEREHRLEVWHRRLSAAAAGQAAPALEPWEPEDSADIFTALAATMRDRELPLELFEDLLSAFRQDVRVTRYQNWDDLLDYCRRSANPVGRLVLRIAGYADAALDERSDAICTALQLTNFWQDLRGDFERGRIYVPLSIVHAHSALEAQLAEPISSTAWRRALADVSGRTRALFGKGRPLCDAVRGRLRYELRATWLGGVRILDQLERADFDPLAHRPKLSAADIPWLASNVACWRWRR